MPYYSIFLESDRFAGVCIAILALWMLIFLLMSLAHLGKRAFPTAVSFFLSIVNDSLIELGVDQTHLTKYILLFRLKALSSDETDGAALLKARELLEIAPTRFVHAFIAETLGQWIENRMQATAGVQDRRKILLSCARLFDRNGAREP